MRMFLADLWRTVLPLVLLEQFRVCWAQVSGEVLARLKPFGVHAAQSAAG